MKRTLFALVTLGCLAIAAEKHAPQGHVEDSSVAIEATLMSLDEVRAEFGSDFGGGFTVVQMKVSPKGAAPYYVRLDDFILRSEASGEHSGPMLPAQVAGAGVMVLERKYGARSNPEMPQTLEGMKIEMKEDANKGGYLEHVKKKMLAEQNVSAPESGLLFFPLDKEKPKNLVLSCTTPAGKLRLQFK